MTMTPMVTKPNLDVTLLVANSERAIGRCDFTYTADDGYASTETWSMCLPPIEWLKVLWTLTHASPEFLTVNVKFEERLSEQH